MELSGKYSNSPLPMVAYPYGNPDGTLTADQYTVTHNVIDKYKQGNHLVCGGTKVGLFWATDIQAVNQPKTIQHAYETVQKANSELRKFKNK